MTTQYEKDFYGWTETQANFLKEGKLNMLDTENLIEELLDLGISQASKLENHLMRIFQHMLKKEYQQHMYTRSWDLTIKNCKFHANKTLKKNPGLKHKLNEIMEDAYYSARLEAAKETGLDEEIFPMECPWDVLKILEDD